MNTSYWQSQFFTAIQNKNIKDADIIKELMQTLDIARDGAYRRLRGKTPLTLDEAIHLASKLGVTWDQVFKTKPISDATKSVTFYYNSLHHTLQSFEQYMDMILQRMTMVYTRKGHLIFAANDVPPYHFFPFKELTEFKIFYWCRDILNIPDLENQKFRFGIVPKSHLELVSKVAEAYIKCDSTELWNDETITGVLKQIEYYVDSGIFENPQDASIVCDQLIQMLNHIQDQAMHSTKFPPDQVLKGNQKVNGKKFNLYYTDVTIGINCILVDDMETNDTSPNQMLFLGYKTINLLATTDAVFYQDNLIWIKGLLGKSMKIAGGSGRQRYQIFTSMINKLRNIKDRVDEKGISED